VRRRREMTRSAKGRGQMEVKRVSDEDEANQLLGQGWDLFTVVAGGGEHVHFILTRRAI
jgi:hypothetical protein